MVNGMQMPLKANVKTTRLELMKTKARIKVANKGLDLLKLKRASLVLEFFKLASQIKELRSNLKEIVDKAMQSQKIAETMAGRIAIERIAMEQKQVMAEVEAKNVMGVVIPTVEVEERNLPKTYIMLSLPPAVDDARRSYNGLFNALIEIAEKESSLRKLLFEIEKLNRRSNAIENVVVPNLIEKSIYIKQRLDDLEKDQIVSLKFIKRKINAK